MKISTATAELFQLYGRMNKQEQKETRGIFAYLINRELEDTIEPSDVLRLIHPQDYE